MMNTMEAKKLNMDELEMVEGGGFFDFVTRAFEITKDFVVDTFENMKVPATSVTEFIGEGLLQKLVDIVTKNLPNRK